MTDCFQFCFNFAFKFNLRRYSVVNAVTDHPLALSAAGCVMHVLAFDGAYLEAATEVNIVDVPAGGRADFLLVCAAAAGAYTRPLLSST
jgi:hypothetical protein